MKITIFGTGFVGLTTGVCLANLGHEIICVDIDENKVNQLNLGKIPFFEPGLADLVKRTTAARRLSFTTDAKKGVEFGEAIFNCVGTPSGDDGSANLEFVFTVAQTVAKFANSYKILINKSTVPPGTAKKCQEIIDSSSTQTIDMISNPEFLKEGNAVYDFMHPDKIVFGAKSDRAIEVIKKVYAGLQRPYLNLITTDWHTSEVIKYANNSFLATKISFINEMANICDVINADVKTVAKAMGMDYRISPKFLNAGIGYGGSCFAKDVKALSFTAKKHGYTTQLLDSVEAFNKRQKLIILEKIRKQLGDVTGKVISIWGLAFKPKTSDIREAPSLEIIKSLLNSGAILKVFDPVAINEVKVVFEDQIIYCKNVNETVIESSAIILVTEWDEFRNVPLAELGSFMKEKNLFDGRNMYDPQYIKECGFNYFGIGR